MTSPVLIDFESRSRADLKKIGGRHYWQHASSEAIVVVWYDTADDSVGAWYPGQAWPHNDRVLAAHNAHGFDRFAAERYAFGAASWIDTSQLARKAGLPGALDALGERWCGLPKDKDASRFTTSLSSPRKPDAASAIEFACPTCGAIAGHACTGKRGTEIKTKHIARLRSSREHKAEIAARWSTLTAAQKREQGVLPMIDAAALERVMRYCAQDVEIMARAWDQLEDWIEVDQEIEAHNAIVNNRGVCFDVELASALLRNDERITQEIVAKQARELGMTADACAAICRSPAQFCTITGLPNAQSETIATSTHPLAIARKALAHITVGKLDAGTTRVHDDGRLRDTLLYYGAHTGRWSSKGMQLHNLPRPDARFERDAGPDASFPCMLVGDEWRVDVDALADQALRGRELTEDEVTLLLRATVTASPGRDLVVCDFGAIEARGTAWAAGDTGALDVFRAGRSPYKVAASAIFGVPYDEVEKWQRQVGKVSELACGYQGGPGAFEAFAHVYQIDLSGLDTLDIVRAWRALHKPIVDLWYACTRAFTAATRGCAQWAGPFEFVPSNDGRSIACFLPSGRPIVYNEPRVGEGGGRGSLSYLGVKQEKGTGRYNVRTHIYGGKIVENAVQGLCRDLLCDALMRAERAGLNPVLHVHDEIICDVHKDAAADAYRELHHIMTTAPNWARDLPLDADGWIGKRYRK